MFKIINPRPTILCLIYQLIFSYLGLMYACKTCFPSKDRQFNFGKFFYFSQRPRVSLLIMLIQFS